MQWEPMGVQRLQDALLTEERIRIVGPGEGTRPPSVLLQEGVCTTPNLGAQVKLFPLLACLPTIPGGWNAENGTHGLGKRSTN